MTFIIRFFCLFILLDLSAIAQASLACRDIFQGDLTNQTFNSLSEDSPEIDSTLFSEGENLFYFPRDLAQLPDPNLFPEDVFRGEKVVLKTDIGFAVMTHEEFASWSNLSLGRDNEVRARRIIKNIAKGVMQPLGIDKTVREWLRLSLEAFRLTEEASQALIPAKRSAQTPPKTNGQNKKASFEAFARKITIELEEEKALKTSVFDKFYQGQDFLVFPFQKDAYNANPSAILNPVNPLRLFRMALDYSLLSKVFVSTPEGRLERLADLHTQDTLIFLALEPTVRKSHWYFLDLDKFLERRNALVNERISLGTRVINVSEIGSRVSTQLVLEVIFVLDKYGPGFFTPEYRLNFRDRWGKSLNPHTELSMSAQTLGNLTEEALSAADLHLTRSSQQFESNNRIAIPISTAVDQTGEFTFDIHFLDQPSLSLETAFLIDILVSPEK